MSYVETLQLERKARLARIEANAICNRIVPLPADPPAPRRVQSRYVCDAEYERSWMLQIEGYATEWDLRPPKHRLELIQKVVCDHFGISRIELLSIRRTARLAVPRHVAMYLCAKLTPRSLSQIGRVFDRDHTSVLHAVRKIERLVTSDLKIAAAIYAIRQQINPEPEQW